MNKIALFFAAGSLGGLANSVVVWLFGHYGLTAMAGVAIAPAFSPQWLYPRLVWGGLWGWLFLLPFLNSRLFTKAAILSLFPTLVQLFIVFPYKAHKGIAGLELGLLTPAFVLFFNWIWGIGTAAGIRLAR